MRLISEAVDLRLRPLSHHCVNCPHTVSVLGPGVLVRIVHICVSESSFATHLLTGIVLCGFVFVFVCLNLCGVSMDVFMCEFL